MCLRRASIWPPRTDGSCVLFNPLSFSSIQKIVGVGFTEPGCEFIFTFLWKQLGNWVASTSCYRGNAHHYEGGAPRHNERPAICYLV